MIGAPVFRYVLTPGWAGDTLARAAQAVPSLDLNFAVTKNVGPLVSFTRASSATYVGSDGLIKTADVNEPRFDHNPTTGESLGLLVEEQSTNLALNSENFVAATWTMLRVTVTGNAVASPTGAITADAVLEQAVSDEHTFFSASPHTFTTATYSIYVKPNGRTNVALRFFFGANDWIVRVFSLTGSGSVTQSSAGSSSGFSAISSSIVDAGNGWYRLSMTATQASRATYAAVLNLCTSSTPTLAASSGTELYLGDVIKGVYVWGAKLEPGAFPTSYFPATTTAATRSADVASITGTNFSSWYNQTEGTLLCNAKDAIVFPSSLRHYADLTPNSLAYSISIVQSNAGYAGAGQNIVAGVYNFSLQAAINLNAQTAEALRVAIAYKANDVSASRNGVLGTPDTVASLPTPDRLLIGSAATLRHCNSPISRITYWPQRLPDSTLQAITQ